MELVDLVDEAEWVCWESDNEGVGWLVQALFGPWYEKGEAPSPGLVLLEVDDHSFAKELAEYICSLHNENRGKWQEKPLTVVEEIYVDMRWSLWLEDPDEYFSDYELERMKRAFEGVAPKVVVHTAPKKEIRYGTVTISKHTADIKFWTNWDSPWDLADTVGRYEEFQKDENAFEAFVESMPWVLDSDAPGVEAEAECSAGDFDDLMSMIDGVENRLVEENSEAWELFWSSWATEEEKNRTIDYGN